MKWYILYLVLCLTSCMSAPKDDSVEVFAGTRLGIKEAAFKTSLDSNKNFSHMKWGAMYRFTTKDNKTFTCRPHWKTNEENIVIGFDLYMCQSLDDIVEVGIEEDISPKDIDYNLSGRPLYGDASDKEIFDHLYSKFKEKYTPMKLETKFLDKNLVWTNHIYQLNEDYQVILDWISVKLQPWDLSRIKLTYELTDKYLKEKGIKPLNKNINDL